MRINERVAQTSVSIQIPDSEERKLADSLRDDRHAVQSSAAFDVAKGEIQQ
jgi:hypothetical protein